MITLIFKSKVSWKIHRLIWLRNCFYVENALPFSWNCFLFQIVESSLSFAWLGECIIEEDVGTSQGQLTVDSIDVFTNGECKTVVGGWTDQVIELGVCTDIGDNYRRVECTSEPGKI